jgi:nucleotide-binding universal stress UspA family protein
MKTILAPIDFSPATKGVIAAASALARSFDGRIVLLNITHSPVVADIDGCVMNFDDLTDRTAKAAVIQLEQIRDQLQRDFLRVDIVQLTGLAADLILEQARKLPADFIVMGSHGHSAFYDLIAGSTTSGVMKKATCPVVIVPPPVHAAKTRTGRLDWQRIAAAPHL